MVMGLHVRAAGGTPAWHQRCSQPDVQTRSGGDVPAQADRRQLKHCCARVGLEYQADVPACRAVAEGVACGFSDR